MLLSGLYGITDIDHSINEDQLYYKVSQALQAGMRLLQYRDKTNNTLLRLKRAKKLSDICNKYKASFIINDDVNLAAKVNAHGVHLGQTDVTVKYAKSVLGAKATIGISCSNSILLAQKAELEGASYISFGRFFTSATKPDATAVELSILKGINKKLKIPICVIGGINLSNIKDLLGYNIDMIAISKGIFAVNNVYNTTKKLLDTIDTACN
jgi:thiamine-phosphate pyrophosphorylase